MIKSILTVLTLLLAVSVFAGPSSSVLAVTDPFSGVDCNRNENKKSAICSSTVGPDANPISGSDGILIKATRIVSTIAGAAAIIILAIGGMRYITSEGDASNVKSAKNTVFYALVGLAVIALAQSLIEFVVSKL